MKHAAYLLGVFAISMTLGCKSDLTMASNTHSPHPVESNLWLFVAKSESIAVGKLEIPFGNVSSQKLKHIIVGGSGTPKAIVKVRECSVLKGAWNSDRQVDIWEQGITPCVWEPGLVNTKPLNHRQVVAFIAPSISPLSHGYFVALRPWSPELASDVNREIERQKDIIARFDQLSAATLNDPFYRRVAELIDQLTNAKTQADALQKLESLGEPAIPAIICQMRNNHRLQDPRIAFSNQQAKGAFEDFRQYRAETVFDALNFLLEQMTCYHFGNISDSINPNSAREQQKNGWRIIYHRLAIEKKSLNERLVRF